MAHPPLPAALLPFAALLKGAAEDFLQLDAPMWIARAPGSADPIGGPAETIGGVSASVALGRSVYCAVQNRKDDRVRVRILRSQSEGGNQEWEGRVGTLYTKKGPPRSLVVLRQQFASDGAPWMMELVAAMIGLRRTHQLNTPKHGFDLVAWDQLPAAGGQARAASRATAFSLALKASTGLDKKRVDGVRVARAVVYGQQEVLGKSVGLTPTLTAGVARTGCLLTIEHGLDPAMNWVPMPDHVCVAVADLGLGPLVSEDALDAVAVGAHMALERLNAALAKAKQNPRGGWGQVTPTEFEGGLRDHVPVKETGAEWRAAMGAVDRPWAARVNPAAAYRLRALAEHHVREAGRARRFLDCLQEYARTRRDEHLIEAGRAMTGSQRSLAEKCGITHDALKEFMDMLNEAGRKGGFFGVRMAECGGSPLVCVLAQSSALDKLREILRQFSKQRKCHAALLPGTGQGGVLGAWWEGVLESVDDAVLDEPVRVEPKAVPAVDDDGE